MPRKPINVKNIVRDGQALQLRKAGASYDQIASQLGYAHKSGAHHAVMRALNASIQARNQAAENVLELELARLDEMLLGLWSDARAGRWHAVDRVLKIMERRAAYLGLDAPKKTELTGSDGGPIQVEQDVSVTLTLEQRMERISYLADTVRSRVVGSLPAGRPDLDPPEGSTNGRVA